MSYRNHSEQRAALGCAAELNPEKHPRRFALQRARERADKRFRSPLATPTKCSRHANQQERDAVRRNRVEQCRKLTHLTAKEAARLLGISDSQLRRIREEFGIEFAPYVRPESYKQRKNRAVLREEWN